MSNRSPAARSSSGKTASKRSKPASRPALRSASSIGVAEAKAHLLRLMDEVNRDGVPIVITKRGKPMVQIAPLDTGTPAGDIFGCMEGTFAITGDVVGPEPDVWEAMQ